MYRVLDESNGNTIGIIVDGKLTKDDYQILIPYFENRINESGQVSLLCDMTQFGEMEVGAFWQDFKFSIRHLRDFRRLAIVGDQRWLECLTHFMNPLGKTRICCFQSTELEKAWKWVKAQSV